MPRLLIKGTEAAMATASGSASTFDNATVVRVVNTATGADTLKSMNYAKAGEKIDGMKGYAAASLFGQEPEEPTAEVETETEVDQEPEEENA